MVKLVHQAKWNLIKSRQELNRSYKEICIPVLEKCRFLLYDIKPAISIEMEAYKNVNILYKEPRVKTLVKKVIKDLKCGRHTSDIQKPEDIVNATIQSQSVEKHRSNEDITKMKKCASDGKISESKSETDEVNNEIKNAPAMSDSLNSNSSKFCPEQRTPNNCTDLKTELEQRWNSDKIENETRSQDVQEKEKNSESNIALNNLLAKLTEKKMRKVSNENLDLMTAILEFVLQDNCDVELLRRAMYCQVKRCKYRKEGLEMIRHLLNENYLLTSTRYFILNGYLGLTHLSHQENISHCLDNIQLVTPTLKTDILLAQFAVTDWCIETLRNYILKDLPMKSGKLKSSSAKVNLNIGTYTLLRDIPRARMLLTILGILASSYYVAVELSPLINSGVISSVLALLRQTGYDQSIVRKVSEFYVLYADMVENIKPKTSSLSGPELASLMKLGTRVIRGADWKWGDQVI